MADTSPHCGRNGADVEEAPAEALLESAAAEEVEAAVWDLPVTRNESVDNQKTVPERLRDHSWFVAFAPAEDPRIAVALIVENGGFGSAVAAPIVRKVMDTYLLDAEGKLKQPIAPGTQPLTPKPGTRTTPVEESPPELPPQDGSAPLPQPPGMMWRTRQR